MLILIYPLNKIFKFKESTNQNNIIMNRIFSMVSPILFAIIYTIFVTIPLKNDLSDLGKTRVEYPENLSDFSYCLFTLSLLTLAFGPLLALGVVFGNAYRSTKNS